MCVNLYIVDLGEWAGNTTEKGCTSQITWRSNLQTDTVSLKQEQARICQHCKKIRSVETVTTYRTLSLTWPDHVQIYWKERKEFNSYRISFLHHHAHRCIVFKNQFGRRDVNWKRSITSDCADVTHCSSYSETRSRKVLGEGFYLFVLAFVLFLTEFVILPHTDKLVHLNIVHRLKWIWIPANIKRANRYTKIYVGRSTTVHNLFFCS